MKSNYDYQDVYITIRLCKEVNKKLSESCARSNRKKTQEAKLRIEDHLEKFKSISELNHTVPSDRGDIP